MTRSIKALSSAAIFAALALPAVASAQDTSSTGSRVTRDSAGARNAASMNRMRFDTTQAIALTGVTIARIDSTGPGASHGADKSSSAATGAMGSAAAGTMGATASATSPTHHEKGQSLTAIIRSGTDSMQIVLAPAEYLAAKQLTLAIGDVINVKGVRMDAGASGQGAGVTTASVAVTTILATEIVKGSTTVQLRDKSTGEPSWETMGSDAGKNRASMTMPPMKKDSVSVTSPVRKP